MSNAMQNVKMGVVRGHARSSASFDRAHMTSYSTLIETRCVIVIDDQEASPSSSDCMTLRSDTRPPVIKMALMLQSTSGVILRVKVMNCERLL